MNELASTLFHHVDHGCGTTIGKRAAIAKEPAAAFFLPGRLRKRALGVERPGANRFLRRIPADYLHSRETGVAVDGNFERTGQKVLVLCPVAIHLDLSVVRVAGPFTDHPFQRLELLVVRRFNFFGFVRHAVEQPFSISL